MTLAAETTIAVGGIRIPNSRFAREITELVRDTEFALLFHHSRRINYWSALAGKRSFKRSTTLSNTKLETTFGNVGPAISAA
jgi:hypothetical protein